MQRLALGLMFGVTALATPSLAQAQSPALQLAGSGSTTAEQRRAQRRQKFDDKLKLEDFQRTPHRKGFYIGNGLATGVTAELNSFIPSVAYRFEIGAGLSDRITLGVSGGVTKHLGIRENTAGVADVVMHAFVVRGLFVKLGIGATSHAPQRNRLKRPGFGGIVGVGWEFRPLKVLGIALAGEFEGRVRTDGVVTNAFMLGLGIRVYPDFKKKW